MLSDPVATADKVRAGSQIHVSRLISRVENGFPDARQVLDELTADTGRAQLIGITGPPGAGKSTLTAALIQEIRQSGRSVGVVAVDPSSPFTGGALLGDRDRMLEAASGDDGVFIRSVASRGAQGGLAAAVNDAVDVLDAMGKDVIIIETVGVGQGEFEIAKLAHTVILVFVPGYGDSLQAMKAGITEIADVVAVNKADDPGAEQTFKELRGQAFKRAYPTVEKPWVVPIVKTSALRREGVDDLLAAVDRHYEFAQQTNWLAENQRRRRNAQFTAFVTGRLQSELRNLTVQHTDTELIENPYEEAQRFVDLLIEARRTLIADRLPEQPETKEE